MDLEQIRIRNLGKEAVQYDRQKAIKGKAAADTVLYFWVEGYKYARKELLK